MHDQRVVDVDEKGQTRGAIGTAHIDALSEREMVYEMKASAVLQVPCYSRIMFQFVTVTHCRIVDQLQNDF